MCPFCYYYTLKLNRNIIFHSTAHFTYHFTRRPKQLCCFWIFWSGEEVKMMDFQILVDDAHLWTSGDIIQAASASPEHFLSLEVCLCTSLNWLFFLVMIVMISHFQNTLLRNFFFIHKGILYKWHFIQSFSISWSMKSCSMCLTTVK